MEDLLQAQFDNELNLLLFDGMATFSINMLIHQINKSESAEIPIPSRVRPSNRDRGVEFQSVGSA